jgi:hypothetical protein
MVQHALLDTEESADPVECGAGIVDEPFVADEMDLLARE